MEYDFRKQTDSSYDSNIPSYTRPSSAAAAAPHPPYAQQPSFYPKIGGAGAHSSSAAHVRNPPFQHAAPPPSSSGVGIRVSIKPEYRITSPNKRCGEMARKLRFFRDQMLKAGLSPAEGSAIQFIASLDDLEVKLGDLESELVEMNANGEKLNRSYNELAEYKLVLQKEVVVNFQVKKIFQK